MKHPNFWLFILGFCVMLAPLIGLMNLFAILALADFPLPPVQILRLIVGGTVFVSWGVGFPIVVIAANRVGRKPPGEQKNTESI
jgi:hypothetical protein